MRIAVQQRLQHQLINPLWHVPITREHTREQIEASNAFVDIEIAVMEGRVRADEVDTEQYRAARLRILDAYNASDFYKRKVRELPAENLTHYLAQIENTAPRWGVCKERR